ncbi:hypothetical protein Tco_0219060 [Tanacetum coccineum]
MFKDSDFDNLDDLVDEGMAFVQEKEAENQGKIGADDTKVVKGSGDTEVLDTEKAVNTAGEGTLIKIKEEKAKEKGVAIKDVEDSSRPETEPIEKKKKKVKSDAQIERYVEVALRLQAELDEELRARIDADYELDARMTQEEQEKYTIEERARLLAEFFERRKKKLAAERAEAIRNKPSTKTQLRNLMMTYLKNMDGYKHSQLKGKSYANTEVTKATKEMKSWAKAVRQKKTQQSKEANYHRKFLFGGNWEYQCWESMRKAKNHAFYKLTRADGSSSYHGDTQAFLRRLDRQDLNDLYRLVQERFQDHPLEDTRFVALGRPKDDI